MECQKDKFSIDPGHHYLNCAYMSPLLKTVEKAGIEGIASKNNPFRVKSKDFFDPPTLLKQSFARLINAANPERIAIIPSVSYLISTVAQNIALKRKSQILLVDQQFPSQVYPWMRLASATKTTIKVIKAPEAMENRGEEWNKKVLNFITPRTSVVCLANVHWADGTQFDLTEIRKKTWQVGAKLIIDGTQSIGALPFDVQKIQPDAVACAGYKFLLGPYSIGLGYLGESFDGGVPIEENWINRLDSQQFEKLVEYQDDYKPLANRYSVGEHSNFILVPMLNAAINQLLEWTPEAIQQYCSKITKKPIEALLEKGYWIEENAFRGAHLFGIRLPEHASIEKIQQKLLDLNIYVSIRGNSIRVSPHVYNTEDELWKLVEILD